MPREQPLHWTSNLRELSCQPQARDETGLRAASVSIDYERVRVLTALLILASGSGQVALLWLHDLDPSILIGAFLGVVYIIIGLGLLGQSRFTLFVAVVVPLAGALWLLNLISESGINTMQFALLIVDVLVAFSAVLILVNTRGESR